MNIDAILYIKITVLRWAFAEYEPYLQRQDFASSSAPFMEISIKMKNL